MSLFSRYTRTAGIIAGGLAITVSMSACDSNGPLERSQSDGASSTASAPNFDVNVPPYGPASSPSHETHPAPPVHPKEETDYTQVNNYLRSSGRTGPLEQALRTTGGELMRKMLQNDIPHAYMPVANVPPTTSWGEGENEDTNEGGRLDKEMTSLTLQPTDGYWVLTSLPEQQAYSQPSPKGDGGIYTRNLLSSFPVVRITVHVVNGKPTQEGPLDLSVEFTDGDSVELKGPTVSDDGKTAYESQLPFLGTVNRGSQQSQVSSPPVPSVSIMGTSIPPTTDAVQQVDHLVLQDLEKAQQLTGSDWQAQPAR